MSNMLIFAWGVGALFVMGLARLELEDDDVSSLEALGHMLWILVCWPYALGIWVAVQATGFEDIAELDDDDDIDAGPTAFAGGA